MEFRQLIRERASQRLLFLPHAARQMPRPDQMISTADVRKVLENGDIIEDYPEDTRGRAQLPDSGQGKRWRADTYRMCTKGRIVGDKNGVYSG